MKQWDSKSILWDNKPKQEDGQNEAQIKKWDNK